MKRARTLAVIATAASIAMTSACVDAAAPQASGTASLATSPSHLAAKLQNAVASLATTRKLTVTIRIGHSRAVLRATSPTRRSLRAADMTPLANLDLAIEHNGRTTLHIRRANYPDNGYGATEFIMRFSSGTDRDGEWLNPAEGSGLFLGRLFGYDKATGKVYVHRLFIKLLGFLSDRVMVHRAGPSPHGQHLIVRADARALTRVTAIGVAAGLGVGRKVFRHVVARYVPDRKVSVDVWLRHGRLSRLAIGPATVRFQQSAHSIALPGVLVAASDTWMADHIRQVFADAFEHPHRTGT